MSDMSCTRSSEIDLPAFLAQPGGGGEQFRDFRAHYPVCPDCAAEVSAWTELHLQLGAAEPAHPPPELLLSFEEQPQALGVEARAALERHLEACAACADELASLRGFDFARLGAAEPELGARPGAAFAAALERLRGWLWQPALAYALVLLLLVPLALERWERLANPPPPPESPMLAKEQQRLDAPQPKAAAKRRAAGAPAESPPRAHASWAREEVPSLASEAEEVPESRDALEPGRDYRVAAAAGSAPLEVRLALPELGPARLQLAVPDAVRAGDELEVRVIQPSGRRELGERVRVEAGQSEIAIKLPRSWLEPGVYRAELRVGGGAAGAERLFEAGFVVP